MLYPYPYSITIIIILNFDHISSSKVALNKKVNNQKKEYTYIISVRKIVIIKCSVSKTEKN